MQGNLGIIERKVLGALIQMMNDDNVVKTTGRSIARKVGYAEMGGSISMALKLLEMKNMIVIEKPFAKGNTRDLGEIRVLAV